MKSLIDLNTTLSIAHGTPFEGGFYVGCGQRDDREQRPADHQVTKDIHMTQPTNKVREAFEAVNLGLVRTVDAEGVYTTPATRWHYSVFAMGWQAGHTAALKDAAKWRLLVDGEIVIPASERLPEHTIVLARATTDQFGGYLGGVSDEDETFDKLVIDASIQKGRAT